MKGMFLLALVLANFVPAFAKDTKKDANIDSLVRSMSLDEKIGQMVQIELDILTVPHASPIQVDTNKLREAILTYKGKARFQSGVKTREEREVEVSDGGEAEGILAGLGLSRRFRYEKRREEWRFEDCAVALDETPIGNFVEVEGDPVSIRRVFVRLDLDFGEAIPYSYAELYQRRRKEQPGLPPDMVWPEKR